MSSPFDTAALALANIEQKVGALNVTRIHPGEGATADAADTASQQDSQSAIAADDWLLSTVTLAQDQADADHALSSAPKPADLEVWRAQLDAITDLDAKQAEIHLFLQAAKARREALDAHTAATITDVPALPNDYIGNMTTPGAPGANTDGGKEKQGADGAESPDDDTAHGTPDAMGEGDDAADTPTPVTMTDGGAPRAATPDRMSPEPISDTAVGTATSADTATATADPRAALSGSPAATAQGSGAGQPSAATTSPTGGAAPQLSQQQGAAVRGSTAPRSPEKRREAQDKADEKDAVHMAATTVTAGAAGGVITAASTAPSGTGSPSTPSPVTATSGAATAAPTPSAPAGAQGTPPAGTGGAPMGGLGGRTGTLGSGNGVNTAKPVIAAEQPVLTPEEQRLLDEYADKGGDKK